MPCTDSAKSSAYERDSFRYMWCAAQFPVFFKCQAIVYIGWRKLADSFLPGPAIAQATPLFGQAYNFRDVTSTSPKATKHEDRLTDFKRQGRFFGNSWHGALVPFCPATKDYPGPNVLAQDASHDCQATCPFFVPRFVFIQFQPLLNLDALAVLGKNDEFYVRSMFRAELPKIISRHSNMNRPCKVVGDNDGPAVTRVVLVTAQQFPQLVS